MCSTTRRARRSTPTARPMTRPSGTSRPRSTRRQHWTDLGVPLLETPGAVPGFIGSTFYVMMPMVPDAHGRYTKSSFLVAGGVPNPPSPGGYVSIKQSAIHTVDTSNPSHEKLTARLDRPAGHLRPVRSVVLVRDAASRRRSAGDLGADRDEVALPGFEIPVITAELFNPMTGLWRQVARQHGPGTYHNTANLLPDGHCPDRGSRDHLERLPGRPNHGARHDLAQRTVQHAAVLRQPDGPVRGTRSRPSRSTSLRTCTARASRPGSRRHPGGTGRLLQWRSTCRELDRERRGTRYGAITHLVDADQRMVELPIVGRHGEVRHGPRAGRQQRPVSGRSVHGVRESAVRRLRQAVDRRAGVRGATGRGGSQAPRAETTTRRGSSPTFTG